MGRRGHIGGQGRAVIATIAQYVEQPAQNLIADRNGNRAAAGADGGSAGEPGGGFHGDATDRMVIEMAVNLDDHGAGLAIDNQRIVNRGQRAGGDRHIDHRPADGDNTSILGLLGHGQGWCLRHRQFRS